MRILFIGDIMGRSGRDAVRDHLSTLKGKLNPDVIIANAENSAHGFGLTPQICTDLHEYGVHVITTGNHAWDQREIIPYMERDPRILRAINYPKGAPGRGSSVIDVSGGRKIMVIHAMGRLYMDALDDPFAATDAVLNNVRLGAGGVNAIFVDFHAEATSEKQAYGNFLDGRVSGVVGTHTHVPTADTRILPGGTAFQTDAGMTGDYDSVIGMQKAIPIAKFTRKLPTDRMTPAEGYATLCGVFIETDDTTGKAKAVQPVRIGGTAISTTI